MWAGATMDNRRLARTVISGLLRFRGGLWQELEDVRRGDDKAFEDDKLSNIVLIF